MVQEVIYFSFYVVSVLYKITSKLSKNFREYFITNMPSLYINPVTKLFFYSNSLCTTNA